MCFAHLCTYHWPPVLCDLCGSYLDIHLYPLCTLLVFIEVIWFRLENKVNYYFPLTKGFAVGLMPREVIAELTKSCSTHDACTVFGLV